MTWVYIGFILFAPAIVYGIALIAGALVSTYYRRPCPSCQRRGLNCVNWIRATVFVNGQRAPDWWAYYVCERCGESYKFYHRNWQPVPESERDLLKVMPSQ